MVFIHHVSRPVSHNDGDHGHEIKNHPPGFYYTKKPENNLIKERKKNTKPEDK